MFNRLARRVYRVPRVIHVRAQSPEVRIIAVSLLVKETPTGTADLSIIRRDGDGADAHVLVSLNPGLPEQPIDSADKARIDAVVAALVAGDWAAFQRLASDSRLPDLERPYFDLFAHKVGRVKRIRCQMNQMGQRYLLVLLEPRKADGRNLTLSILADGQGESTTFLTTHLEEEGFDREAFEREARRVANRRTPPLPLWKAHPELPRYSIGWRMGYGQSTLIRFAEYFAELSDADRTKFAAANPEPVEWSGFYRGLLRKPDGK